VRQCEENLFFPENPMATRKHRVKMTLKRLFTRPKAPLMPQTAPITPPNLREDEGDPWADEPIPAASRGFARRFNPR
jgi:hypothetical protein